MDLKANLQINERVRLLRPLKSGGMGSVWVGYHKTLETQVAVKFMTSASPAARVRFAREARAVAKIRSSHVVQVLDHGQLANDTPYIVMELLKGVSLQDHLNRKKWLSLQQVDLLVHQLGRALTAAHAKGVVHRDIKPDNIILLDTASPDELEIKLIDFGVAKDLQPSGNTNLTQAGAIIGTPRYMSPEQFGDADSVDRRADVWGVGTVVYQALTGKDPFSAKSMHSLIRKLYSGKLEPVSSIRPEVSGKVDEWFARTLAIEPRCRFSTAREMAKAFRTALSASNSRAPFASHSAPPASAATMAQASVTGDEATILETATRITARRQNTKATAGPPRPRTRPRSVPRAAPSKTKERHTALEANTSPILEAASNVSGTLAMTSGQLAKALQAEVVTSNTLPLKWNRLTAPLPPRKPSDDHTEPSAPSPPLAGQGQSNTATAPNSVAATEPPPTAARPTVELSAPPAYSQIDRAFTAAAPLEDTAELSNRPPPVRRPSIPSDSPTQQITEDVSRPERQAMMSPDWLLSNTADRPVVGSTTSTSSSTARDVEEEETERRGGIGLVFAAAGSIAAALLAGGLWLVIPPRLDDTARTAISTVASRISASQSDHTYSQERVQPVPEEEQIPVMDLDKAPPNGSAAPSANNSAAPANSVSAQPPTNDRASDAVPATPGPNTGRQNRSSAPAPTPTWRQQRPAPNRRQF